MHASWPKAVPLLILSGLLVYANCVTKTLVFDDDAWIVDIANLDHPWEYLKSMPGRPLLAISNLAMHNCGRNNPVPHHVLNIFIHLAATLTLYGLIRRSLLRPRFAGRFEGRVEYLAFAAALLWMIHPLQVQCVTYIIQRSESMAGLFYMLILYAMLRGDETAEDHHWRRAAWYALAVLSVVLGYASKEILASAPGAVILFDRIFLARSWREAIRKRWVFYLFFLLTWGAITAWNMTRAVATESGIGFKIETVTPLKYALTQAGVILYYLQISVWPRGLIIDYQSWPWTNDVNEAMPELAIVGGMLLITAMLLLWRPAIGFVCAWFFIALAPTSSVLPIVDAVFEHRMYLSLASVTILAVFLSDWLLRITGTVLGSTTVPAVLRPLVLTIVAGALGVLTFLRTEEYRSRSVVWGIAVERMPNSVRARTNYAQGLLVENDINNMRTVVEVLQRGVELSPYDPTALQNLAAGHEQLGEYEQAAECYRRMRDAYPSDWKNWRMYAATLLLLGRWEEAEENYRRAAEINRKDTQDKKDSESAEPHYGMAAALYGQGRDISADAAARNASTIDPNWPEAALGIARNVILDERLRAYPDARRSALTWAELGMKYAESPHPMHHDTLGLCRAAMGDFKGAELASRAGLAASPAGAWGSLHKDRIRDYQRRRTPWPD